LISNKGQQATENFSSLDSAKNGFEKKYNDKTKNSWANKANFVPVKGKYTLIEIDYGDAEEKDEKKEKKTKAKATDAVLPTLFLIVYSLCLFPSYICNFSSLRFRCRRSPRASWTIACKR